MTAAGKVLSVSVFVFVPALLPLEDLVLLEPPEADAAFSLLATDELAADEDAALPARLIPTLELTGPFDELQPAAASRAASMTAYTEYLLKVWLLFKTIASLYVTGQMMLSRFCAPVPFQNTEIEE